MNTFYSDVASLVNNSKNSIHVEVNELNSTLYQIKTPFQLTYIAYNRDLQSMNITTLSGKYSHQYTLHQSDVKIQYDKRILHFHDYFELVVILDGVAFRAKCKIFSRHLQKPILKTEKGRFKGL